MKLSSHTIGILKNFSTINPSILVKPGNVINTISPTAGTMFASAVVEEEFPQQFGIHKLPEFLGVLSLFNEPELSFNEKQITISEGNQRIKYTLTDSSMITSPPANKTIKLNTEDIVFDMSSEMIQRLVKASAVLQLPEVSIKGDGKNITVNSVNVKNPTTNEFNIKIGSTDKTFNMILKVENIIKILHNNYQVTVSAAGITRFVNQDGKPLTYYIANEMGSKFGG